MTIRCLMNWAVGAKIADGSEPRRRGVKIGAEKGGWMNCCRSLRTSFHSMCLIRWP